MEGKDFYLQAHLVVAAIRVIEHEENSPPSIEKVCRKLSFSLDHGNFICRKLQSMGIIEVIEGAYGTRLFIKNHVKIEEIPQDTKTSSLKAELEKFQNTKKGVIDKIETIQAEQTEKKKNLFAELEKQLKKGLDRK